MGMVIATYNLFDDDRETPEETGERTPAWMSPQNKLYTGKDKEGKEMFIRVVKYP